MAQQRGVQRAVLPPAIAGWLAQEMLARFPVETLVDHMVVRAPARLARSFIRRLALLDATPPVQAIARSLLSETGWLGTPRHDLGQDLSAAASIVHLDPVGALGVALRMIARETPEAIVAPGHLGRSALMELLAVVALDARCFEASVDGMARLACAEAETVREGFASHALQFFQLSHAATQASNAQRTKVMDDWLGSPDPRRRALGLKALAAGLTFQPGHVHLRVSKGSVIAGRTKMFETVDEARQWIADRLDRLVRLADTEDRDAARALFLDRFSALARWDVSRPFALETFDRLENGAVWPGAWFALCRTLARTKPEERNQTVRALEARLRPRTLQQRYDAWLDSDWHRWENPEGREDEDEDENAWEHGRLQARSVGFDAAHGPEGATLVRRALEPGAWHGFEFGKGFAEAQADWRPGWNRLVEIAGMISGARPDWRPFSGFLDHLAGTSPANVDACIDQLLADPALAATGFLVASVRAGQDDRNLRRILNFVRTTSDLSAVRELHWTRPEPGASDDLIAEITEALLERGLVRQAWRYIDGRLHKPSDHLWNDRLAAAGRRLLSGPDDMDEDDAIDRDYGVSRLASRALREPKDAPIAARLLVRLRMRALERDGWLDGMPETMAILSSRYPNQVLDAFLLPVSDDADRYRLEHFMRTVPAVDEEEDGDGGMRGASREALKRWTLIDPVARAPRLANVLPFWKQIPPGAPVWTNVMRDLIDACPEEAVFDVLERRLTSGGGTGSLADRFRERRPLLEALACHPDERVVRWASDMLPRLDGWVTSLAEGERSRDERFE